VVLAVCDSPIVRQLLAGVLAKELAFSVTTAFDWRQAEEKLSAARPDVVLLCSERLWPDDEGARPIHEARIPLVVGTVDVRAPKVQAALLGVVARVREAPRRKPLGRSSGTPRTAPPAKRAPLPKHELPQTSALVAIGASAGGTMALKSILQEMPPRAPAIVIVQHMSEHFTGAFAQGLERICSIDVREAQAGDPLVAGRALIAPGNRHIVVERRGREYFVGLVDGPLVSRHRPSVNVLFRSLAQEAGPNAVGVILTGMGDDGADGLFEMKELGARTIAQNEATSVVFGMPRAAILRGGVEEITPLSDIPSTILKCAGYRSRSSR
jgi:two-component system, chemotaxis family, protein-glutamate methylesterase/glutaminase